MSPAIPIAAFADARTSLWGVFVGGATPLFACARVGSSEPMTPTAAALQVVPGQPPRGDETVWELRAGDSFLTVSEAAGQHIAASRRGDDALELCQVKGTAGADAPGADAADHELDCPGVRLAVGTGFESLRLVAAWFPGDAGVALLAVRPRGARGHGEDRVSAVLTGAGETLSVFDPRLSTTYGGDGAPLRVGIELWLGESQDAELHLRRFSGEAGPTAGSLSSDGLTVNCQALAAHDGNASGLGIYLLARSR